MRAPLPKLLPVLGARGGWAREALRTTGVGERSEVAGVVVGVVAAAHMPVVAVVVEATSGQRREGRALSACHIHGYDVDNRCSPITERDQVSANDPVDAEDGHLPVRDRGTRVGLAGEEIVATCWDDRGGREDEGERVGDVLSPAADIDGSGRGVEQLDELVLGVGRTALGDLADNDAGRRWWDRAGRDYRAVLRIGLSVPEDEVGRIVLGVDAVPEATEIETLPAGEEAGRVQPHRQRRPLTDDGPGTVGKSVDLDTSTR